MKKLFFLVAFGIAGYISAASPVNKKIHSAPEAKTKPVKKKINSQPKVNQEVKKSELLYRYEYGMGAVDTANGTCFTYGLYICLDDSDFCTFTPHNTGGTVPTTCLGEGNYQA